MGLEDLEVLAKVSQDAWLKLAVFVPIGYEEQVRAALMDPPKSTKPFTDAERAWAEEHYQDLRDTLQTVENNIRKAQAGGVIQPAYLRMENPLIHDMGGRHYRDTTYYDLIKKAKLKGGRLR